MTKVLEERIDEYERALWFLLSQEGVREILQERAVMTGLVSSWRGIGKTRLIFQSSALPPGPHADMERDARREWWKEHELRTVGDLTSMWERFGRGVRRPQYNGNREYSSWSAMMISFGAHHAAADAQSLVLSDEQESQRIPPFALEFTHPALPIETEWTASTGEDLDAVAVSIGSAPQLQPPDEVHYPMCQSEAQDSLPVDATDCVADWIAPPSPVPRSTRSKTHKRKRETPQGDDVFW